MLHSSQLVAPVHLAMVADLNSSQRQSHETALLNASSLKTALPQKPRGLHPDIAHLGDTCQSKQLTILRRMVVVSLLGSQLCKSNLADSNDESNFPGPSITWIVL